MQTWIKRQESAIRQLRGRVVVSWHGVEMAVREEGANGLPVWHDATIPFLQLDSVDLAFAEGSGASIWTYQNDTRFGLCINDAPSISQPANDDPTCIFRSRSLDELPVGEVRDVAIALNQGDIAEIVLSIEAQRATLLAGEIHEECDGSLRAKLMDESVLVQLDSRHPLEARRFR